MMSAVTRDALTEAPLTPSGTAPARWPALAVLCAGQLMIILDGTIVTVALPSIRHDLGFSQSGLAWVLNAYLIAFGGLLPLAGRLGDLIGRKRIFLAGLSTFVVASLLCGLADGRGLLIVARFLQGIGGAMASAVVLGMLVTMFPQPRERAKAIGAFTFVGAGGSSVGMLAGGVLTQLLSWHWIFLVNVPIGLVAALAALRVLATERGIGLAAGADIAGAALITGGLMLGVYTIVGAADLGWASAHTVGFGAVAIALLAGFVARQATAANPMLPLRIFGSRFVSGANLVQILLIAAMFGFQFLAALYLRQVLGYGPVLTGLAFLPTPVLIAVISLGLSARINARFGLLPALLAGTTLIGAGLAVLTRAPVQDGYLSTVLPTMLLLAIGFGSAMPALTTLAMSDATDADSGLASGLFNTTQQIGAALGLAVLATLATERSGTLRAAGTSGRAALTGGYQLAFTVAAGLALAAIGVAALVLRSRRHTPSTAQVPVG